MINIAFWNLHKNENIVSILEELIVEYDCDIVVLAESDGIDLGFFVIEILNPSIYEVFRIVFFVSGALFSKTVRTR